MKGTKKDNMASILYFLLFLSSGCVMVRFLLPEKRILVRVWLGLSLGTLLMMWLPVLWAYAFRFDYLSHGLAALTLAGNRALNAAARSGGAGSIRLRLRRERRASVKAARMWQR